MGFRTVLPFARNNIDDGEEAPRAVMKTLRELPLVSSVASGVFRLSTNGYKYQERVIDKMFEQERAVKRLSADRLVREWAKAGQMDPDSSAADKLEEWGKRYGWDESDQTEVLTDAINTWQGRLEDSAEDREWKLFEKVSKLPLVKQEQIERWRTGRMR